MPDWEKRFRAPRVSLPDWAEDAPDRSLFVSNATGTYELYAWDRSTGEQRQVTARPNGTTDGVLSPDGEWIWWFDDKDGDEFGVWRRQPFAGGPDELAAPGLDASYPAGLALGRDGRTAVVGRSTDEDGTTIHLVRTVPRAEGAEAPAKPVAPVEIYRHRESAGVGDLSHDGSLIAVEHTEHGDAMHSALRVLRPDGTTVAELDDTKGGTEELGLEVLGFAPVDGDTRLLIGHQRRGRWEPMVWDVATGEETDLSLELPGDVSAEWFPDGTGLLIAHGFEARSELFRYDLAGPELVEIDTPPGTVSGATARPDGSVEYLWSSSAQPSAVRSTTGEVVLDPPGMRSPGSVPVEDVWVEGPGGRIHALVQKPEGATGPLPTGDHRSRCENSEANGGTWALTAGNGGPEYDTCSSTIVPRPVAAATAAASGSICGPWSPLSSEPSDPAGSLLVADSSASVHSPGSATSPGRGGRRSTARSISPSVSTILLVPTSAVATRAGAAVSASDSTVVEMSARGCPWPCGSPPDNSAAWSSSSSMCRPRRRL
ncbi:hypothetical protein SHIRM173S_08351 [Streptomyces hirsutus]